MRMNVSKLEEKYEYKGRELNNLSDKNYLIYLKSIINFF